MASQLLAAEVACVPWCARDRLQARATGSRRHDSLIAADRGQHSLQLLTIAAAPMPHVSFMGAVDHELRAQSGILFMPDVRRAIHDGRVSPGQADQLQ